MKRAVFVAEIDGVELALRIAEIACEFKRPDGMPAAEALDALRASQPKLVSSFERMAAASIEYVAACIDRGSRPS